MNKSPDDHSVFASYNSHDRAVVQNIVDQLLWHDIQVWLDVRQLLAGQCWLPVLEAEIKRCRTALIFLGPHGQGPWQVSEIHSILERQAEGQCTVIPVLLAGGQVPLVLRQFTWVDFNQKRPDPIQRLINGIRNSHNTVNSFQTPISRPTTEWACLVATVLAVVGVSYGPRANVAENLSTGKAETSIVAPTSKDPFEDSKNQTPDDIWSDVPNTIAGPNVESSETLQRYLSGTLEWKRLATVTHTAPNASTLIERAFWFVDSTPTAGAPRILPADPVW